MTQSEGRKEQNDGKKKGQRKDESCKASKVNPKRRWRGEEEEMKESRHRVVNKEDCVFSCVWPERLGAVELSAVRGGEITIDVLQHQVTEHIT